MGENAEEIQEEVIEEEEVYTPATLAADNLEYRQATEAEDAKQEEELRRAMRPDGTFRSLKHKMAYAEEDIPESLPGGPDPKDYHPDSQEQFEQDYVSFQQTGKLADGLDPTPDDDESVTKDSLVKQIGEHRRKAILAESKGDSENVNRHNYFARHAEKELDALGPDPREVAAYKNMQDFRESNLEGYFDGTLAETPSNVERLTHDAAIESARHIADGNLETIYLPMQTSPHSFNHKEFVPANVIKFKGLPGHVKEAIALRLSSTQDKTPESIFNAVWTQIEQSGYSSHGQQSPVVKPAKKKKAEKKATKDPRKMTQAQYNEYRIKQGARHF